MADEEVAQLFNTLDPFPFKERDLDSDVEEYIVGWARELPREDQDTLWSAAALYARRAAGRDVVYRELGGSPFASGRRPLYTRPT